MLQWFSPAHLYHGYRLVSGRDAEEDMCTHDPESDKVQGGKPNLDPAPRPGDIVDDAQN